MNLVNTRRLRRWPGTVRSQKDQRRYAVEFGSLAVPLRRDADIGTEIEVGYARFISRATKPGVPIFYLAGGPGGSGLENMMREPNLLDAMLEAADVIAVEQRGTELARPCISGCPGLESFALDQELMRDEAIKVMKRNASRIGTYWAERGYPLAGFNTRESAQDLNDLRLALDLPKMSLHGESYGSHLALITLRHFEAYVERAWIGLVEGPDDTNKMPSNVDRHFRFVSQLVEESGWENGRYAPVYELMQIVHDRVRKSPVRLTDCRAGQGEFVITDYILQSAAQSAMGDFDAIRRLPSMYAAWSRGDYSIFRGMDIDIFDNGMAMAMDSASGTSAERLARIEKERRDCVLDDVYNLPFPYITDDIGALDLGDSFRLPVKSNVPVLFVSCTLDGRTPRSNVTEMIGGFPNARELIIENSGHGAREETGYLELLKAYFRGEDFTAEKLTAPIEFLPA